MEIASANPPATLAWNSAAAGDRADGSAAVYQEFDVSDGLAVLAQGTNVLAIHGLNDSASNGEFLILPELVALSNLSGPQYMTTPTAGTANTPRAA